uniref:Uncharacterized protein n=1 Tax=Solanum tuberosum TaxID=4113 RepID=M1CCN5_SOLTU
MNYKALFLACFIIILCSSSATSRRLPGYRCNAYKFREESCSPRRSLYLRSAKPYIQPPDSISSPDRGS